MILWGDLMKKKLSLLLLLFLVCILSISAISATENTANNDVMGIDNNKENNLETNIYSDVSTGNENCKLSLEQNNDDKLKDSGELNFNDLNRVINGNSNSTINLSNNYKYNEEFDQDFVNGIIIDRDLTIYGNGITLNGNSMARIFNVIDSNLNVSFYDIHFKNGHSSNNGGAIRGGTAYNCNFNDNYASNGGAICGGTAYNCTFKDNEAKHNGGAIFDGNAYYCTFTGNEADNGGAMSDSNAYNSTFKENEADNGGAMYDSYAYNCKFTGNEADDGGAMYNSVAFNCTFTENNADNGGAMYNSTADGCLFKENEADTYGGAIRYGRATNCDFVSNLSEDNGGALSQADAYNSTFTENKAYYHKDYYNGGAIDHGNAYNCTFTKNKGWHGGAIYVGNAYNCIFKKNYAFLYGGAIYDGDAYNCIFTENDVDDSGGAMYKGNAYNCTFTKNDAPDYGEAMYGGKAALCKFSGNSNDDTDIVHTKINVLNYVSTYKSGERLKFNLTAGDVLLDGFNTTIEISKEGQLYTTVYGLSGEGWIVDLALGEYTAVLSLTDFPKEKSSSATITVRLTFTDLNTTINGNNNSTIYLSNNDYYKYDTASDNELINGIIINRDLTIYGNGATIDGDKIARIFKVENNVNVKFLNINFRNGKADYGGAICGGNAYNCSFTNNTADYGGAIYLGNATDCTFANNAAEKDGGAMSNSNAYNCTFIQNHADNVGGAMSNSNAYNCTFIQNHADNVGGAIYECNATDSTFANNTAESGGAIYGGNAYKCSFEENKADTFGGAMYRCNAYDCTFAENKAVSGGAIIQGNAYNCTFTDNTAEKDGGAIFKGDAINCTFIGNTAHHGGAMNCEDNNRNYTAEGCTFIGNSADGGGATYFVDVVNCIFTNNTSTCDGGAVYKRTAVNCTFTGNTAERDGGAIFKGDAINCTFIGNTADHGGAMNCEDNNRNYTAEGCTFIGNSADGGGATYFVDVVNCIFTNNTSTCDGGAVYKHTAVNCTFTGNTAKRDGGAIFKGDAINCTFIGNSAKQHGGAMYEGTACLCIFNEDSTKDTKIIHPVINVLNYTSTYNSGEKLKFNLTANDMVFDGFKTTIAIYKNTSLVKTDYALTGEGWIVDLGPGEYTAVLSLTDYPDEKSSNATINVSKGNTIIDISPINNAKVGQELTINYTTNSNGTVTIKVNGQKIKGSKFTPTKEGIYNLTVEVAENDYYIAASNKTTFTVEKTDAVVEISPITNVVVGQEVTINYTTNSNGTVTIKVNGQIISGTKFTPTKEGSYNVSVDVAENDYYTAASNETSFTVEKTVAVVEISPITNVVVGQEVTIKYDTNSNGTVTVKVNGQKIKGSKFIPTKEGSYNVSVDVAENDYYTAASNETSFTVEKTVAVVEISPITNVVVGQEVTIKYDTNSNGTVTVKVNGQKIKGSKFTPTKEGSYNVSVDVAENDYYTAASNETAFTVEKTSAVVVISPIADVVVGQEVTIKYDTNSNGTVTIKVNGQKIEGSKFTPTKDGSYVVTVDVAENDYYAAASNETSFTVVKTVAVVVLSPVADVVVGREVTIKYDTNSNGTVTVKVNGQKISGAKFTPTKAGSYVVTVDVAENDYYTAASNETSFTVEKIDNYTADINVGEDNVTVMLPEDINGKLTVKVGNETFAVPVKNGVAVIPYDDLPVGENSITVTYPGDSKYAEKSFDFNVTVKPKVIITVKDLIKYYGSPDRFIVNIKDSEGRPIAGQIVYITLNGRTYNKTTDNKGMASIGVNLNSGNYTATVTVNETKLTAKITVLSTINGKNIVKIFHNATQYYVTARDSNGNYLPENTEIDFNINGVFYKRKVTGDKGLAKLNINLIPNTYIITAYNTVTGERTSNNITVLSRLTENKNITMYEKNGTKYTVRVLDETGKAVGAGENVTFNINGVLYTRTTDSNGYAALNINLMSGNYIITAMYGDSKVANNIKILPRLVASNLIKKYGTPDQFKAQLLDGKGNPVVGEKITFNINGIFYYRPTDADGFAKLNINLMPGKYIITSSYGSFVCGNTVTVNA